MERNPGLWDIVDLATHLRQERLFVNSEQNFLRDLNEQVLLASSKLAQAAWVTSQQRLNLNQLVSSSEFSSTICCKKAKDLDLAKFVDGQQQLGFQKCAKYAELLSILRDSPELISKCLVAGDKCLPEEMPAIIHTIIAGLYTSCVLPKDKNVVLKILDNLISLQIIQSENPRKLLRQGSCAFARLYSAFHESLFSAKIFLTAALHDPIMNLLLLEEKYLDIDPEKVALRLQESKKKPGFEDYKVDLETHRVSTIKSLVNITQIFISSLQNNLHCFPSSVFWLVNQIHSKLSKANNIAKAEIFAICSDLVFTLFICPAIIKPEPYGITDIPISSVARCNLIQVAQIIQTLAMRKFQPVDPRLEDIYSQFDKGCESIVDSMIDTLTVDEPLSDSKFDVLGTNAALFTDAELNSLLNFLRTILNGDYCDNEKIKTILNDILIKLPQPSANGHVKTNLVSPELSKKPSILSKGKGKINNSENEIQDEFYIPTVFVIPYNNSTEHRLGLDSEQKILSLERIESEINSTPNGVKGKKSEGQEKRTRFSLSHDDGSIGNTSDNLEVVSEAPSNHSVASSLELETEDQNDNLSDMISANVSGRGSPNISGRDTPSSQITEGEETTTCLSARHTPTANKIDSEPRFDIDDKFGKFEIKNLIERADETFSLVSDTWSTDVLASDSEMLEQQSMPPPPLPETPVQLEDPLETASEAWSTDVMASDSERMIEVDTDDTASVARSDDTGRSGDPEPVEDPVISPAICTTENVTGRGGAQSDYRRRTFEYIDHNRMYSVELVHSMKTQEENSERLESKTSMITNSPSHSCAASETLENQQCQASPVDGRGDQTLENVATFSASSSSSNSSVGTKPNATVETIPSTNVIAPNGSICNIDSSTVSKPITGTIPKSISFDKTAERGDKESLDEDGKPKRSFFRNFKLPFKNRRGKPYRGDSYEQNSAQNDIIPSIRTRRSITEESRSRPEISEDILEKYRSPRIEDPETKKVVNTEAEKPINVEKSYDVFEDARKKLRIVLSTTEILQLPDFFPMRQAWIQKENELVAFLQLQLAEAINLQDISLIPQLYETLRCIKMLDEEECQKLFVLLKQDYKNRVPYISYLVKCRQSLLSTLAHLDRLMDRVNRDKAVVLDFLSSTCVNSFYEKHELQLSEFISDFKALTMADEKSDLLEKFFNTLSNELERDPVWKCASNHQINKARITLERSLCCAVYAYAMYPNGDGDISRDQVLSGHIAKLAKVISPDHKDLRIPHMFHCECPWLSAQAEIRQLAAYRSPSDKLHCVIGCITTIMNLLSLTCVPAADDLMPVLVYVIIMANPPSLMSTIEYVTNYYGNRIEGEEQYYWTQFCSAIEFIKTMDYLTPD